MIYDLVVIGGGPAGMMAAISAAQTNQNICLLERNSSLGKKLLLTGKGRCNFTSNKSIPQIVDVFGKKGKFFYGALSRFSNRDLINFFKKHGVESVVERGERVFPKSNRANTILECLINELNKLKLKVIYNFRAIKLEKKKIYFLLILIMINQLIVGKLLFVLVVCLIRLLVLREMVTKWLKSLDIQLLL